MNYLFLRPLGFDLPRWNRWNQHPPFAACSKYLNRTFSRSFSSLVGSKLVFGMIVVMEQLDRGTGTWDCGYVCLPKVSSQCTREREICFRQLGPGRGIRRSPLSEDDMSLGPRGGSIYADLWWPFYLLYIINGTWITKVSSSRKLRKLHCYLCLLLCLSQFRFLTLNTCLDLLPNSKTNVRWNNGLRLLLALVAFSPLSLVGVG